MKRSFFFLLASLMTAVLIACTVTSNVGDLGSTSGDASSPDGPSDGAPAAETSLGDASSSSDADGASPMIDAGCGVTFAQEATPIDIQVRMAVSPMPTAGTVVAGTYILTAMDVYLSGTTGTARVRETMEVHGGSPSGTLYRLIEITSASGSFKNVPLHGETSLYQADFTTAFFVTPQCPTQDFQMTGNYSAAGDMLSTYDSTTGVQRTYRRLR